MLSIGKENKRKFGQELRFFQKKYVSTPLAAAIFQRPISREFQNRFSKFLGFCTSTHQKLSIGKEIKEKFRPSRPESVPQWKGSTYLYIDSCRRFEYVYLQLFYADKNIRT